MNRKQDPVSAPADSLADLFDNVLETPVPKAPEDAEYSASTLSVDEPVSDQTAESPQTTNTPFSFDDLF